jgi:hypothetical protein
MPTPNRKTMRTGANLRPIDLAATARGAAPQVMLTTLEQASEQRRALYHTQRWLRRRLAFLRDHPLCVECERRGLVVAAVVVDHRDGHRHTQWRDRFWDEARWQALCIDCHNVKSAKEQSDYRAGLVSDDEG